MPALKSLWQRGRSRLRPGELTSATSSPSLCCRGPGSHFEVFVSCPLSSDPVPVPEAPHSSLALRSRMARGTAPFVVVTWITETKRGGGGNSHLIQMNRKKIHSACGRHDTTHLKKALVNTYWAKKSQALKENVHLSRATLVLNRIQRKANHGVASHGGEEHREKHFI